MTAFSAVGVGLFLGLMMLVVHRGSRLSTAWGALWGPAAGFWLLAPMMLRVHHARPETLQHWMIFAAFFFLTFAIIGSVLAFLATVPVGIYSLLRGRDFKNPEWAYAIWPAVWLPLMYVGLGALIEWSNFARLPAIISYGRLIVPVIVVYTGLLVSLLFVHRQRAEGWSDARTHLLSTVLVTTTVLGALAMPFRVASPLRPKSAEAVRPLRHLQAHQRAPLLVIGLDGANWRSLRPLIERGRVPTLSRLAATGIQGEVDALWPPYWSNPAWAAILTGYGPDETDVHEDLSATVEGLPPFEMPLTLDIALDPLFAVEYGLVSAGIIEVLPTPRSRLRTGLVWERLSRAGVKTAVIRFPFTYPATGQADFVVSNRVVNDLWDMLGVRQGQRDHLVEPLAKTDETLAQFSDDRRLDPALLSQLLPDPSWPKPADSPVNPVDILKRAATISQQMHTTTVALVRKNPDLRVVMLYIAGIDNLSHAFWQYRFPEDFTGDPPAPADVAQLGPVLDRYYELLDQNLAELIKAFPSSPNVLIVSDHGEGPAGESSTLWRGWHQSPGLFLAAGPDLPHQRGMLKVSYHDVLPTILELQDFDRDPDLRGRSVLGRR